MKFLIEIPDEEASFGMKVLKSLSFIKGVALVAVDNSALSENLKEAAAEVRLHKQGKIKLKTAQELLNEL